MDKHVCRWPGCSTMTPAALWGCGYHYALLPREMQRDAYLAHTRGDDTPSHVTDWIKGIH